MRDNQAMNRGRMLYDAQHYEQAGAQFLEALSLDPQNAEAQAMLALCLLEQKQWRGAVEAAREAVRLDPEEALAHEALAVIYLNANRLQEAEQAIERALSLDPDSPTYWHLAGNLAVRRFQWKKALEAAERGLAVDPTHGSLLNLRSLALIKLGRLEAAREGLREVLSQNPDDPISLCNLGWAALHGRQSREALELFKSALRLDPENEYARHGLMEGLRSRYPFYGLILRFFLWMSSLSRDAQNAVQTGLYVGQMVLNGLAEQYKWLRPWVRPLMLAYTMFAYMTWLATPITNLLLRLNPYGRLVLTREDRLQSNLVGGCLGMAGLLALTHALTGSNLAMVAWVYFLTLSIPVAAVHECQEGWPRSLMAKVAAGLAAAGLLGIVLLTLGVSQGWYVLGIFFQLLVPAQFLAMYLTTVSPELGHEN